MTALRILAVDDEQLALRRVELLLSRIPGAELIGVARSGVEALREIERLRPDVLLLDIGMAGMDGLEVVEALDSPDPPRVIFVTALDSFAARAFELNAIDYVVKPVDRDRLARAVEKARREIETADARLEIAELRAVVAALRAQVAQPPAESDAHLWVQRRGEFVRLTASEIEWVEAERDYVRLHARGRSYLIRHTLHALHERLGGDERFLRVRRSALVRADSVATIRKAGAGDVRVRLVSGTELRVGGSYVAKVRAMLGQMPTKFS